MNTFELTYNKGGRAAHFRGPTVAECERELKKLNSFFPRVSSAHITQLLGVNGAERRIVRVYQTRRIKDSPVLRCVQRATVQKGAPRPRVKAVPATPKLSETFKIKSPGPSAPGVSNTKAEEHPLVREAREMIERARATSALRAIQLAKQQVAERAAGERVLGELKELRGKNPADFRRLNNVALCRAEREEMRARGTYPAPPPRRVSGRSMHLRGNYVEDLNQSTLYQNLRFDLPSGPYAVGSDFLKFGPGDVPNSTKPSFAHDPSWVRRKEMGAFSSVGQSGRVPLQGEGWQSWNKVRQ